MCDPTFEPTNYVGVYRQRETDDYRTHYWLVSDGGHETYIGTSRPTDAQVEKIVQRWIDG